MEKYRGTDKPKDTSAAETEEVEMNAWQKIMADFETELGDGKGTFARKSAQQSVQEEYSIYVMGALSAGSTFDTLGFWKVRFLQIRRNIYSH